MADLLPILPWVRSFEAAARHLNFTEAAVELGLTQAAVSQHIRLLEAELGERLFERGRRGVTLTGAGAALLPHVQSAFRSLTRSAGELFGGAAGARIEIRSPISFATLWLAPRLPELARALPRVALDVTTIHRPGDYDAVRSGLDIRFGTGRFHGQSSIRLTREALVPVAAASVAAGCTDTDWRHLPLLAVAGAREMWAAWFEAAGLPPRRPDSYRFDSFVTAMEAARSGTGVLLGSRPLIDRALASGELVPLSAFELRGDGGHFLTYPAREAPGAATLALLSWLQSEAERDWANAAGPVPQTITESSIDR